MPIDIGAEAIDRADSLLSGYTFLAEDNPANDSGTIDTVEVWFAVNGSGLKVGTFYGSGTSWTLRDYATLGSVTAGSKQTFTNLNITVETGDLIGCYYLTGYIERDTTGFAGVLYYDGDTFGGGTYTYTELAGDAISLYGTGGAAPTGFLKPCKIW